MRTLTEITASTATNLITVDDFRLYAKAVDIEAEDTLIANQIKASVKFIENFIGQSINANTIELTIWDVQEFDVTDGIALELPMSPITSVTSVKGYDNQGIETTLTLDTDWYKLQPSERVRIIDLSYDSYKISYTAAMTSTQFDDNLRTAVLKIASELYDKRSISVIGTITAEMKLNIYQMLNGYRKNLNW